MSDGLSAFADFGVSGSAAAHQLSAELRQRIMSGDLPAGTRLRQEALAAEFGVSRMPVREALQALAKDGLLVIVPRRGAFVRGPSGTEVREAYQVRAELEGLAAALATEMITDEQRQRMADADALFKSAVDRHDGDGAAEARSIWPEANNRFHDALLDAAGNMQLAKTVRQLHQGFPRNLTWSALNESSALLRRNASEHNAILTAIGVGDADAARVAARDHVLRSGELIARRLERTPVIAVGR